MEMAKPADMLKKTLFIIGFFIVGTAIFISIMPKGFKDDLSLVGQGKNIAVLGYSDEIVQSVQMMAVVTKIRDTYKGRLEFLVADVTSTQGVQFQKNYGIDNTTIIFFAPDGRQLTTVSWPQTAETLRQAIDQAYHF